VDRERGRTAREGMRSRQQGLNTRQNYQGGTILVCWHMRLWSKSSYIPNTTKVNSSLSETGHRASQKNRRLST